MFKYILRQIRLFSNAKKESYLRFREILGFFPDKIEYYQLALRHKSEKILTEDNRELSNERLEFLGDSILNSVITDIIYHRFEDKQEGFLSSLRARLVSRESLNSIALELGLDKMLIASRYVNRNTNRNVFGNALEALLGAIYLDFGYRKCKSFIENRLYKHFLNWDEILKSEINFKSKIFEWCHKNHLEPEFILLEDNCVRNRHSFRSAIKIKSELIAEAVGSSKKESEQEASRIAFQIIEADPDFLEHLHAKQIVEESLNGEENYDSL